MRPALSIALLLLGCSPAVSAEPVAVPPFSSVQLRNGGEVRISYGDSQRVTVVEGDAAQAGIRVEDGRLIVDHCRTRCSHREPFRVEVVTPRLEGAEVEHGGRLIVLTGFPRQAQLAAAVSNGGMIDARALEADQVAAAVSQGGAILTRPVRRLDAAVSQGGAISYWGNPVVTRAIRDGGVVGPGRAEDADRPLADMTPQAPIHPGAVPPVPPVPPTPRADD